MIKKSNKTIFANREEAFQQLLAEIPLCAFSLDETVVLGVSEGGVYFAEELSRRLNCPMDILLTEPIYSNVNETLVIAMVGETEEIVMHKALTDSFDIPIDYIYSEADRKYQSSILNYIDKYRDGKPLDGLDGKYVILVDECVETGLTMMTAVKTAIELGATNIFIAVPILDNMVYKNLVTICDNLFCPHKVNDYVSIEYYYETLKSFSFKEIKNIMIKNKLEKNNINKGNKK
jgi:putative phosphoribosyl transferase